MHLVVFVCNFVNNIEYVKTAGVVNVCLRLPFLFSFNLGDIPRDEGRFPVFIVDSGSAIVMFCVFLVLENFSDGTLSLEPLCIVSFAVVGLLISELFSGMVPLSTVPKSRGVYGSCSRTLDNYSN